MCMYSCYRAHWRLVKKKRYLDIYREMKRKKKTIILNALNVTPRHTCARFECKIIVPQQFNPLHSNSLSLTYR